MKKNLKRFSAMASLAIVTILLGGCTPKNITYLQDLDEQVVIEASQRKAMRVQPEDKISIVVSSKDPELATLFNLPIVTNNARVLPPNLTSGTGATQRSYTSAEGMSAYTVSPEGNIDFPILGTLHVAGMTRSELAGFIQGEIVGRNLMKDPTVTVEFLNTGISLLGEVARPGRYDMNRDNISIVEGLALAGDLTINGMRESIKVIREESDGSVKVYEVDLTNGKELLKSPVYYLKQNDVIYVEPNDKRKRDTTVNGNTALSASFWISAASFLTSIASLVVNLTVK